MITAIIPCKDEREDRLMMAVDSAAAVCDEVIVCDDGSTVPVVIDMPKVRVVRNAKALGPPAACNVAADAATGLYLARLDCGDKFFMSKREQIVAHLQDGIQASFSVTVCEKTGIKYGTNPQWQTKLYSDNVFAASSTIISRALFKAVGGYDESLRYCDDWDFHVRVQAEHGWHPVLILSGTSTQWDGGHTDLWNDEQKIKRWSSDHAKVAGRARALSHSRLHTSR
jgi:glycosyltransferase involved in cell wall biosynthesis